MRAANPGSGFGPAQPPDDRAHDVPDNIADGPEAGGLRLKVGEVRDVDGALIANLAQLVGDARRRLFDPETGDVRFTGSLEANQTAAPPDVDPAYRSHCIRRLPEYVSEDAVVTYVTPTTPPPANRRQPTRLARSGLACNGVRLDGPAPLDAILGARTIAPFDDCGGHVNPHVGFFHHAGAAGSNASLGCLAAQAGCTLGGGGAAVVSRGVRKRARPREDAGGLRGDPPGRAVARVRAVRGLSPSARAQRRDRAACRPVHCGGLSVRADLALTSPAPEARVSLGLRAAPVVLCAGCGHHPFRAGGPGPALTARASLGRNQRTLPSAMTIDNISGCIGCGICVEARPVDAITLAPRKTIPVAVSWG